MSSEGLSVGKVAKRCGVAVSALHFYETKGLIQSWRNAGNQRRYDKDVLRRVAIIKAAQAMGISLGEVAEALALLPNKRTPTMADWERLASEWQAGLDQRIRSLQGLRELLTGCIGCGCLSMTKCPIYNAKDKCAKQGDGAVLLDRFTAS